VIVDDDVDVDVDVVVDVDGDGDVAVDGTSPALPHLTGMRALAAALLAAGCVGGVTPAQCAIDSDCGPSAFCFQTVCIAGTRTCPTLQPTFSSINSNFIQVGCGTRAADASALQCHAIGSENVGSGPSFAGHPYAALVNAEAANRLGTATGLILVKPGDPANSFLITKLKLTSPLDPAFGGGQPADDPGSTCASALSAIEQWIQDGAKDN